jgi:hypothetical protein
LTDKPEGQPRSKADGEVRFGFQIEIVIEIGFSLQPTKCFCPIKSVKPEIIGLDAISGTFSFCPLPSYSISIWISISRRYKKKCSFEQGTIIMRH